MRAAGKHGRVGAAAQSRRRAGRRPRFLLLLACIGCILLRTNPAATAADLPEGEDPSSGLHEASSIIRVSSDLVTVPVSVTDSRGQAIEGLQIQDFLIEEDGRPEAISKMAEAGRSPLRLVLLFDVSGSVNPRFDFERRAAVRFLEKVWKPGDTISIVAFSESPKILLRESASPAEALKAIATLEPTEKATAFFDAVAVSAGILRQATGPETRQAVVALSDGEDNRSSRGVREALREVQRADTIFYSINPGGASIRLNEISLQGQSDMKLLAKETGGYAFVSDKFDDLDGIFDRITAELQTQYLLSYYSTNARADGKYRRISVSIPGRRGLSIHTRQGYYASVK